ncbi:hypothetical protein D9M69_561620 [compost metagenome]
MHDPVLRRHDIDPFQLVFGRHLALDILADAGIHFAQIAADLFRPLLVHLNDLQRRLGDLFVNAGDPRGEAADLSVNVGCLTLERADAAFLQ